MADENQSRALTNVDVTYTNPGCTCEDGTIASWITADFRIVITPNGTSYKLQIYTRLYAQYYMTWTGAGTLKVKVTWKGTDGTTKTYNNSIQTSTPLQGSGQQSSWNGPLTFTGISAIGAKSLNVYIDLDLLRTMCINHKTYSGPDYERSSGSDTHFQHFYLTKDINVESIPLVSAPTISSLVNTNKYNNQDGVSASTNSIGLSWTHSGGSAITESYYRIGTSGSWIKTTNTTSHTVTGLSPGTSYTIQVYSKNSAGDSNTLSITVRTRHDPPVVSLTLSSIDLERLTFNWSSDKSLGSTQYKIDNGSWTDLSQTGTSGSLTAQWFDPKTTHTIYFRGVSTSTYDSLSSNEANESGTTYDIAHIDSIGTCIFGTNISITISSESSKKINLQIKTTGNGRTPIFNFENIAKGTYTFSPTQAQLDEMYKCFTNTNSIPIYFLLTTVGDNKSWNDTQQEKSLQLTGIAKTAHVGVNNSPKRAQAFIGVNNSPKRAVFWVGDSNNVPRRCI